MSCVSQQQIYCTLEFSRIQPCDGQKLLDTLPDTSNLDVLGMESKLVVYR